MKVHLFVTVALLGAALPSDAQPTRVAYSRGEVSRSAGSVDRSRLTQRVPGVPEEWRSRVTVAGDSAQTIALADFEWRGRVLSVEFDEEDSRIYWDVKIVPDSTLQTIVRYRVDAGTGGILSIREFTGIRGIAAKRP